MECKARIISGKLINLDTGKEIKRISPDNDIIDLVLPTTEIDSALDYLQSKKLITREGRKIIDQFDFDKLTQIEFIEKILLEKWKVWECVRWYVDSGTGWGNM